MIRCCCSRLCVDVCHHHPLECTTHSIASAMHEKRWNFFLLSIFINQCCCYCLILSLRDLKSEVHCDIIDIVIEHFIEIFNIQMNIEMHDLIFSSLFILQISSSIFVQPKSHGICFTKNTVSIYMIAYRSRSNSINERIWTMKNVPAFENQRSVHNVCWQCADNTTSYWNEHQTCICRRSACHKLTISKWSIARSYCAF